MPELARFMGIIISMRFHDTGTHNKPHVHVTYGEYKASINAVAGKTFSKIEEN